MVHAVDDLNRLKEIGLVSNVTLFPHGVSVSQFASSSATVRVVKTVATYGFCLPNKGIIEFVKAARSLIDLGSDIDFKLINAEYPVNESQVLGGEIRELIDHLGLQGRMSLYNDFLPINESLELLRQADLVVYPYQSTNESSSAAVRNALAMVKPVLATPLAIFDDLRGSVYRTKGTSVEDIVQGIFHAKHSLEAHDSEAQSISATAAKWRSTNDFSALGARLEETLIALLYQSLRE